MILNLLMAETQIVSDVQVWNQEVSQGKKSVLKFAKNVVHKAEKQEFNTNNIFVTGHSLGGGLRLLMLHNKLG